MEKLKPCPFCNGEIRHEGIDWNDIYDYGGGDGLYVCDNCGLKAKFPYDWHMTVARAEKSEKLWNTRYEPTCQKVPGKMKYGTRMPKCSNCDQSLGDKRWNYCPKCGCKVVD